jgi:PAS domain S-box-containing protein
MLSLISEVNQTIVRVRDRDELFRKLCEIAVEKGNLSMAWVGMVDPGTGMILPAASCGDNGGYLEGIRISTGDVPEGQGPIGMAVRKNVVSVVADIAVDDRMGPWKDRAARLGYHSTAGLPIRLHGKPIGALGIYSPEVGGFDDEVIRLLEEAAEDISLAISSIDTETKHRATEALLAESEERFRTAFEGAAIGMVMVGPDMKFIDVNRSFCAILGRTREELMSGGFISVTHPDDAEASQLWVQRMLAGEDVPMNLEKRYVHKDGHVIWAEVSTTLLKDRRGKPRYFITEIKDISERLRTAAQLDELERSLQLSRRRLSLLTELTRHDILNQLTASLGYLELARGGTKEEDALKDLERLRVSLERIQKLAEFTRMYQDVGFAAPEWQGVGALVSVSADQIAASRIELVADCGDYQVFADRMLESVIRNLMDNSVRHGRNVKNIRVACALSSEALKIVYEDDGIGIAEADKERVFERGFGAGSGIGLLLAREILAITNISIVENGQPGRGARFEMTVPPESWRRP